VSLRDIQDFARHADPKTTRRHDRARHRAQSARDLRIAHYLAAAHEMPGARGRDRRDAVAPASGQTTSSG
jgi:hypothetical protein